RDAGDPTIVNPARLPPALTSEVCGQCHGISCPPENWLQTGIGFRPGQRLRDQKPILRPEHFAEPSCAAPIDDAFASSRYWKDGMVRVSGREYNGLVESPCFKGGAFSCLSCHSMHDSEPDGQLIHEREGNAACMQCHRALGENIEAHSHHRAGSPGAAC